MADTAVEIPVAAPTSPAAVRESVAGAKVTTVWIIGGIATVVASTVGAVVFLDGRAEKAVEGVREEVKELRADMKDHVKELRGDMQTGFRELRSDIKSIEGR